MTKKTNVASSGYTAIQVGHVGPPNDETLAGATPEPSTLRRKPGKGQTVNIRRGNARVGVQADVIIGDIEVNL